MTTTLHDLGISIDPLDAPMVCSAINSFGSNDHALADERSLQWFAVPYVVECLTTAVKQSDPEDARVARVLDVLDTIRIAIKTGDKS